MNEELPDIQNIRSLVDQVTGEKVSVHRDADGRSFPESEHLGDLCFADEDFRGALAHYQRAQEQGGDSAELLFKLGTALDATDAQDEALESFTTSFEKSPEFETAMAAAAAAKSLGQRRLAEEWFNRAIAVQPQSAFAWHKLALFQREGGRRKEALKTALRAAQIAESAEADAPYYWHSAGDLALDAEDYAEAETCLRKALEGSPTDHETMILLGIALWRQGKGEESLRSLRLAMELEPEPRLVPGLVSVALRVKGLDDDAEAEEKKIDRLGRYDKEQLARLRSRMID